MIQKVRMLTKAVNGIAPQNKSGRVCLFVRSFRLWENDNTYDDCWSVKTKQKEKLSLMAKIVNHIEPKGSKYWNGISILRPLSSFKSNR